jgi:hypothetical protein
MRRDQSPTKKEPEAREYTFHFQITNEGGRKACMFAFKRLAITTQQKSFVKIGQE